MARHYIEDAVNVGHSGTEVASRAMVNFIDGANVTLTVADNAGTDSVDVTVAASAPTTGWPKLFESTLNADTASIDTGANGVAGGHGDLVILVVGRLDSATNVDTYLLRFNNDSGANYGRAYIATSAGGSPAQGATTGDTGVTLSLPGANATANVPGQGRIFLPAYDATTFYKTMDIFTGNAQSTTAGQYQGLMETGLWSSTAAITRVAITPSTGSVKFKAGTRLVIYGAQ